MKQFFAPIICICIFAVTAAAQRSKGTHSLQLQHGFAYASDLCITEEMQRGFTGVGYQYTNKKNWYVGTNLQYSRNTLDNAGYAPTPHLGEGELYICDYAGSNSGKGYFLAPTGMLQSAQIVTSSAVTKVPGNQPPLVAQDLEVTRVNVMLHAGKRWQKGRSQFEAGVTLTGTVYNYEMVNTNYQTQAIDCRWLATGQNFKAMFTVTNTGVVNRRDVWLSGGFHGRYQYNLGKKFGAGVEVLTSMSTHGILAQVAPRLTMNF